MSVKKIDPDYHIIVSDYLERFFGHKYEEDIKYLNDNFETVCIGCYSYSQKKLLTTKFGKDKKDVIDKIAKFMNTVYDKDKNVCSEKGYMILEAVSLQGTLNVYAESVSQCGSFGMRNYDKYRIGKNIDIGIIEMDEESG